MPLFGLMRKHLWNAEIDWDSGAIKMMLAPASWTPAQFTQEFKSSVTEISTVATTLSAGASAGATSISVAASIPVGAKVLIGTGGTAEARMVTAVSGAGPYSLTVAALTNAHSSSEAVVANSGYTARGLTMPNRVAPAYDGTSHLTKMDGDDPSWNPSYIAAAYAVVYLDTASDATSVLIAYWSLGGTKESENGPFTVVLDSLGAISDAVT